MATFIENLRNSGLLPTKSGVQGTNFTPAQNEVQSTETLPEVPKAPNFTYKNPVTDNNIEYWRGFADDNTMKHYDEFLYILDEASTLNTMSDIKDYMNQLKGTIRYNLNDGYKTWVNDLEALCYMYDKKPYDKNLPLSIMRYQTEKAKTALENGYKKKINPMIKKQPIASPSEFLQEIKNTYK